MAHSVMQLALAQTATLGEGLLWQAGDRRWWWTDIEASTVQAWSPGGAGVQTLRLPDRVGSMAHCRSGRLLVGLAKRLGFVSLPAGRDDAQLSVQGAVAVDPAEPRTRVNDGRTDRRGFFVFGTLNEDRERRPVSQIASFYQYSLQHGLRRLALPAAAIANSICFSLDGRTMYFCDTLTQRIQQCDYDAETAQVGRIRLFAAVDDAHAWPDGSVIARDGSLWNAQWGAGRVVQYGPDGALLRIVEVPVKNPSCPAFGGENLDQLMVTTARQQLRPEELARMPLSGSLFTLAMGEALGVADTLFDDADRV